MKRLWAILIWGVLIFAIGTYLDRVREMLMLGIDPTVIYIVRFGVGLVLAVLVVLVGRWLRRWLGGHGLGPGDWFMIGAVAWVIQGGYGWWMDSGRTVDIEIHDTIFVLARWQMIGGLLVLYVVMGLIYYLSRGMNRVLGFVHFFVTHAALYLLLWMRDFYPAYEVKGYLEYHEWIDYNVISGAYLGMAMLLVAAQLLFVGNLVVRGLRG